MLTKDTVSFPDQRIAFFKLVQVLAQHCCSGLLELNSDRFQLVLDSMVWAIKHHDYTLYVVGLEALHKFLIAVSSS